MHDEASIHLDCAADVRRICASMVDVVGLTLRKRGVVIGLSGRGGGVDSSVSAALAARAL